MSAKDPVADILALVDRRAGSPVTLLAIDGHSAAGKSTLARSLCESRPDATIIQTDDFYRPLDPDFRAGLDAAGGSAEYYDWQRLRSEVLQPLQSGVVARFRAYDWAENALGGTVEIEPQGLIIVEGCYSARPALRAFYDAIVIVASSSAVRQRRQHLRNDATPEWLERWDAAERYYMEHDRPDAYADLIVRGLDEGKAP